MFNKKYCENCKEKINKKNNFCPSCGTKLRNSEKDWGMLGKTDKIDERDFQSPFLGSFSGKILNNMLGNVMKMLEKEMQKEVKNTEKMPKTNFKLMINGKEVNLNNQNAPVKKEEKKKMPRVEFEKKQLKAFIELPKEEPKTNLRRFGDKITYELEMPEVKSFKDILINKLETSIEIKAIGKKRAYFKIIPINMPITSQKLSKGKLILELKEN